MVETKADHVLTVLHVNHSVEYGGAELALSRLLRANASWRAFVLLPRQASSRTRSAEPFDGLENDFTTILRSGPPTRAGATRDGGLVKLLRFGLNLLRHWLIVGSSLLRIKPDVVWANSSRSAVYTAFAPRVNRTALVLHLRDRVEREALGRIGYLAMKLALRRADGVVANSESTLASARGFLKPSARATVLASPAGLVRVSPDELRTRRLKEDGSVLRIGMVARLDPWKGQHLVIRAFASALEAGHDRGVVLHLAGAADFGHESYRRELVDLVSELKLEGRVRFEGRVVDVNAFVDRMDICVQYSTRPEPLGQNVLQYLARGSAVIASDEGGPAEWIGDDVNGVLVRPNSPSALGEAILGLLKNDSRRLRLGLNAAQTSNLRTDEEIVAQTARFLTSGLRTKTKVGAL